MQNIVQGFLFCLLDNFAYCIRKLFIAENMTEKHPQRFYRTEMMWKAEPGMNRREKINVKSDRQLFKIVSKVFTN